MSSNSQLRLREIFSFWIPLASTWQVMSFEGPFLTALIARAAEPKENLAAYGVAFSLALIAEAPVIMMLSASTALVEGSSTYRKLRRFTMGLNAVVTAVLALMLIPPLFDVWAVRWMRLPEEIADTTWFALICLLPWPAAIGYRRFFQGLMIRKGRTRRVLYGTLWRLASMTATGIVLWRAGLPGAWVGALALTAGVVVEAVVSRVMARESIRDVLQQQDETDLSYREIMSFYLPLAATSFIGLAAQPLTTFFMGRALFSLESLAVLPVVIALTFIFRSFGLAYQETAITFLARDGDNVRTVRRFAYLLAAAASACLAAIALTPLSVFWFEGLSNLSPDLAAFAWAPTVILIPLPALSVLLSLQRALMVHARRTALVTIATGLELVLIFGTLLALIQWSSWAGATIAAIAYVVGRLAANTFLIPPSLANPSKK